jgi:hypothetical protein
MYDNVHAYIHNISFYLIHYCFDIISVFVMITVINAINSVIISYRRTVTFLHDNIYINKLSPCHALIVYPVQISALVMDSFIV